MIIGKVISGAQNGVDIAALRAAKACGITTGGCMPRGWRTLDGAHPEYAEAFGMVEHAMSAYQPRTRVNVKESDFTLRIATNFGSPGERCTLSAIHFYDKPHADIWVHKQDGSADVRDVAGAIEALREFRVKLDRPIVLNVAGNSEHTSRGIGALAFDIVHHVLTALNGPAKEAP